MLSIRQAIVRVELARKELADALDDLRNAEIVLTVMQHSKSTGSNEGRNQQTNTDAATVYDHPKWFAELTESRLVTAKTAFKRGYLLDNQVTSAHMCKVIPDPKARHEIEMVNKEMQDSRSRRKEHSPELQTKLVHILRRYFFD